MVAATHTDVDIQQDVLDELVYDPRVAPNEVGVRVHDGVVTLLGDVDTYTKRLAAEAAAHRVRGVKAVANELAVHLPQAHARTDEEIATAAVRALRWSTSIPDEALDVTVSNGWITLKGKVSWHYQREAAEQAVRELTGVQGVSNAIEVAQQVKAAAVRAKIEAALVRNATVDAHLGGTAGCRAGRLGGAGRHQGRQSHHYPALVRIQPRWGITAAADDGHPNRNSVPAISIREARPWTRSGCSSAGVRSGMARGSVTARSQ